MPHDLHPHVVRYKLTDNPDQVEQFSDRAQAEARAAEIAMNSDVSNVQVELDPEEPDVEPPLYDDGPGPEPGSGPDDLR